MSARRVAALGAVVFGVGGLALAIVVAVQEFPRGLIALACVVVAFVAAWYGVLRRGVARAVGLAVGAIGLAAAIVLLLSDRVVEQVIVVAALILSVACARAAFGVRAHLPPARAPRHPVLFYNPKSGGGKAQRFALADEARARGIEPIELGPPWDLEGLVRDAVAGGADGLAMAGGDGSQAIVAAIAAELDLPYACVPAGTRNHFALDLGVDRDDVVGALDAFVDGGERRVDLADVNGRVFVNNVSLGLYAEAVQRPGYRDAKVKTLLDTVPDLLGPDAPGLDLRWTGPGGHEHSSGVAILVSNNRYRLGRAVGSGTRPRIDDGRLGITVAGAPAGRGETGHLPQRPWREWTAPDFEVDADDPVPAGIDGEAAQLDPPLLFHIRPGVLRARIARRHPGASPSALLPESLAQSVLLLARIAAGRGDPARA
ncbi:MAG TPA: diacylglycerol kinase family protein [Baekduia sp.]|jgi:diacylglycerol kinase family enzyme